MEMNANREKLTEKEKELLDRAQRASSAFLLVEEELGLDNPAAFLVGYVQALADLGLLKNAIKTLGGSK